MDEVQLPKEPIPLKEVVPTAVEVLKPEAPNKDLALVAVIQVLEIRVITKVVPSGIRTSSNAVILVTVTRTVLLARIQIRVLTALAEVIAMQAPVALLGVIIAAIAHRARTEAAERTGPQADLLEVVVPVVAAEVAAPPE